MAVDAARAEGWVPDSWKTVQVNGVETGIHYPVPNHRQPAITGRFGEQPPLPRTEQAVKEILSLPIHGELALDAAEQVCETSAAFYRKK
jgi:dTDP-4-amino-4,6-dideoxygalactose transaminase